MVTDTSPAPSSDTRAPDRRWTPRLATSLVFLVAGLGFGGWAVNIPLLKAGLGLTDATLGVALLGVAGGAILAMPLAGHLAGKVGAARLILLCGLGFAAVMAALPHAPTLWAFVPLVTLLGMGFGSVDVAMNTHAALIERHWGAAIMSSFHAAFSLGGLAGAALGGALLAAGADAALCLGVLAALSAVGLLLAVPFLGHPTPPPGEAAEAGHGFVLPDRAMLGLGILALLAFFTEGAVADWSALYLIGNGASDAAAAGGFAAFSLAMTLGRLTGDAVVRRLGGERALRWGGTLAAAGLLLALAVPRLEAGMTGLALVGLGLSNAAPVLFTAAGRAGGATPGRGVAAVATLGYAGMLAGPPLIGFLAQGASLRVALLLLALAPALIALRAVAAREQPT
ncbi:MFS transporter [Roseomonas sp. OT10]|uniref:MFS transporter n=1 Tax=Roseomonas cutis TaxID=2897332 RepID=UPI001E5AAF28|nr:MFS transporter [Roseomonas sp. OT10]UFN47261.1 MFS transporter [Roseomonas sp. OT10]